MTEDILLEVLSVGGIGQYLAPCPKLVMPMDTSGQSPLVFCCPTQPSFIYSLTSIQ